MNLPFTLHSCRPLSSRPFAHQDRADQRPSTVFLLRQFHQGAVQACQALATLRLPYRLNVIIWFLLLPDHSLHIPHWCDAASLKMHFFQRAHERSLCVPMLTYHCERSGCHGSNFVMHRCNCSLFRRPRLEGTASVIVRGTGAVGQSISTHFHRARRCAWAPSRSSVGFPRSSCGLP